MFENNTQKHLEWVLINATMEMVTVIYEGTNVWIIFRSYDELHSQEYFFSSALAFTTWEWF